MLAWASKNSGFARRYSAISSKLDFISFLFLKLQLDFSIKNGDGRTGHPHRLIFPFPSYEQVSSGKAHPDGRFEQSSLNSRNRRRTGTRAASQGFTRAPLVDSQPDMMRIDDLHISGIYSLRKTRMLFDNWPLRQNRRVIQVRYYLDRVGIAHR